MRLSVARPLWHRLQTAVLQVRRSWQAVHEPNVLPYDKYAKHGAYHWQELVHSASYRAKVGAVRALVPSGATCLDLGCGDGAYVGLLAPRCRQIVGIDADAAAIRLAREQLSACGVTNAPCHHLPLSRVTLRRLGMAQPFDMVYAMDVIEHLPHPDELLAVACRVVTPGGLVVIGTPLWVSDAAVSRYHVQEFRLHAIRALLGVSLRLTQEQFLPQARRGLPVAPEGFYLGVGTPH